MDQPYFLWDDPGPVIREKLNEWVGYAAEALEPATSSTSLTIGTGTRTLQVPAGRAYGVGSSVRIARTTDPTMWMQGVVTAYNDTTLTVAVSDSAGTGTYTGWTVTLAGGVGPAGDNGWSALWRMASDGQRRVLEIYDWTGGTGSKPATGYIGSSGLVQNIAQAVDLSGPAGPANTLTIGTVQSGETAAATITGDSPNQTLNLTLPKGDTGPGNSLSIGTVQSGETAAATITGDAPSQTLNLTLPKGDEGDTGPANTLTIGTVNKGEEADASITGDAPNQTLNLVLPQGDEGDPGSDGWTMIPGAAADGERRVMVVSDWTGGTGTKPPTGYLGPSGIVSTPAEAEDVRGAPGSGSVSTVNDVDPDGEGNVELGIADIPGLEDALTNAGSVVSVNEVQPDENGDITLEIADIPNLTSQLAAKAPINNPTFTGTVGGITKAMVGLGNVDNTSDADKPVSVAMGGALGGKVDKQAGYGLSQENYTPAEKSKLAGLESSRFKGEFPNLSALIAGVPDPGPGDYANVDAGIGEPVRRYIWDDSDEEWLQSGSDAEPITASQVKILYESNADTNGFTDALKGKLDNIAAGATANATNAQLRDRSTHTGTQPASTITGLANVATSGNYLDLSGTPTIPTIPAKMPINEAQSGTSTTQRTIDAATLKAAIDEHGGGGYEVGDIRITARSLSAPEWLPADGAAYLQSSYPALFAQVGIISVEGITPLSKLSNPVAMPPIPSGVVGLSPDGTYLATGGGSGDVVNMYKRTGNLFAKMAALPSLTITSGVTSVAFAPDNEYFAASGAGGNGVDVYRRSGDTFTKVTTPTNQNGARRCVAFSHDSQHLVLGTALSPFFYLLRRSGANYIALTNPSSMPTSGTFDCAYSGDGSHLAVAVIDSPYFVMYSRSGNTYTKLTDPSNLPSGRSRGVALSHDATYIAIASDIEPYLSIYKRSGSTLTKLEAIQGMPFAPTYSVTFSSDGLSLAVSGDDPETLIVYRRNGDAFTRVSDVNQGDLKGQGRGVALSGDDVWMAVGTTSVDGGSMLALYRTTVFDPITQFAVPRDPSPVVGATAYVRATP